LKSNRSTRISFLRRLAGYLWRGLVAGLGYALTTVLGGALAENMDLPPAEMAAGMDPTGALLGILISGIVIALALGALARRLPVPVLGRVGVLFLLLLAVSMLNFLEGFFFTTVVTGGYANIFVTTASGSAGLAILLALLYRPAAEERTLASSAAGVLRRRSRWAWLWRIAAAGVLFALVYVTIGALIAPLVLPFYTDSSLNLLVPDFWRVIVPLQLVRGLLFTLTILPLLWTLRGSRWALALWVGLALAALIGWAPMIQASFMSPLQRTIHGLEITVDSALYGLGAAWLLGNPSGRPRRSR
jgi:hypothetical protein